MNDEKTRKSLFSQKATQILVCTRKQRKLLFARRFSIRQLSAFGCWNVTLMLLFMQNKFEYHKTCCHDLVAAACQDGSAWNERKNYNILSALCKHGLRFVKKLCLHVEVLGVVEMGKDEWKGAMQAIVGSNLQCSQLNSKSPLMYIVGKQRKDHTLRSLNYCFLANQWVLFFAIPFLAHKDFSLTVHLKTAKCECLWSSAYCRVRMVVKLGNCQVRIFLKQCRTGGSSSYLLSKKIFMLKQKSSNLCMRCSNSVKKVLSNHLSTSHWHAFINALH